MTKNRAAIALGDGGPRGRGSRPDSGRARGSECRANRPLRQNRTCEQHPGLADSDAGPPAAPRTRKGKLPSVRAAPETEGTEPAGQAGESYTHTFFVHPDPET